MNDYKEEIRKYTLSELKQEYMKNSNDILKLKKIKELVIEMIEIKEEKISIISFEYDIKFRELV